MQSRQRTFVGLVLLVALAIGLAGCTPDPALTGVIGAVANGARKIFRNLPGPQTVPPELASAAKVWDTDGQTVVVRVLPVAFMPDIDGKPMWQYFHEKNASAWFDPKPHAEAFAADIGRVTWGKVKIELAPWVTIRDFNPFKDGKPKYTAETYRADYESGKWDHSGKFAYGQVLEDLKVRDRIEKPYGDPARIDEVWIFSAPGGGMAETCMAGKGAFFCNGEVVPETEFRCSRPFVIYGLSFERGVDCMVEDLGHRVESTIGQQVYAAWNTYSPDSTGYDPAKNNTMYDAFVSWQARNPGAAACGFVHVSPNTPTFAFTGTGSDKAWVYDWSTKDTAVSNCDDWLDAAWVAAFPGGASTSRAINCDEWLVDWPKAQGFETHANEPMFGSVAQRLHHLWWLMHVPHFKGVGKDGRQLNWWKYIFAWDQYNPANARVWGSTKAAAQASSGKESSSGAGAGTASSATGNKSTSTDVLDQ